MMWNFSVIKKHNLGLRGERMRECEGDEDVKKNKLERLEHTFIVLSRSVA